MAKFEGTPEELAAYERGVADERERMRKIVVKYHETFGKDGDVSNSSASMNIGYVYNFVVEARKVK